MSALSGELAFAKALAVEAGEVLLRHFGTGLAVEMKGWADPVTAADRESETLIDAAIRRQLPRDGVDGEEEGRREGSSGRMWVVDPLDGTANFSGGMPLFAVVLTLVEAARPDRALLNVTHDPIRRETFHAVRGGGAYLNDRPIHPRRNGDLSRALVHIHFSNNRRVWEASVELARGITAQAPHARNVGSTALAQAYVAAGRLDAHVKVVSGGYDVVGGNLLVEEAGGVVTDLRGAPWASSGGLLAGSREIHPKLLEITREVRGT